MDSHQAVDNSAHIVDSTLDSSVKVFFHARIQRSTVGHHASVGDFTRVDDSLLEHHVRLDRNNHVYRTSIGAHSYTGQNTVAMACNIGRFCSISWNASIGPPNHDIDRVTSHSFLYNEHDNLRNADLPPAYDRFEKPCLIGNDVWIGASVTILRGVRIGDGAVVGAGSVVTKDVLPYSVVVGVPAKAIRLRFQEPVIELLQALRWWDWADEQIGNHYNFLSQNLGLPEIPVLTALLNNGPDKALS